MKRSTNTAPVSLSTSYLIGSPCIGISMMTLQSFGTSAPAGTRSRLMRGARGRDVMRRRSARLYRGGAARSRATSRTWRALLFVAFAAQAQSEALPEPAAFSSMHAGGPLEPWTRVAIAVGKKRTQYDLVM